MNEKYQKYETAFQMLKKYLKILMVAVEIFPIAHPMFLAQAKGKKIILKEVLLSTNSLGPLKLEKQFIIKMMMMKVMMILQMMTVTLSRLLQEAELFQQMPEAKKV